MPVRDFSFLMNLNWRSCSFTLEWLETSQRSHLMSLWRFLISWSIIVQFLTGLLRPLLCCRGSAKCVTAARTLYTLWVFILQTFKFFIASLFKHRFGSFSTLILWRKWPQKQPIRKHLGDAAAEDGGFLSKHVKTKPCIRCVMVYRIKGQGFARGFLFL